MKIPASLSPGHAAEEWLALILSQIELSLEAEDDALYDAELKLLTLAESSWNVGV